MSLIAANSGVVVCGEFRHRELSQLHGASGQSLLIWPKTAAFWSGGSRKRECLKTQAFWSDVSKPSAVEMEAINDSDQLDRILGEAQQLSQPILIDWMASWCRKCIYLKPKLEKLAAEFDSKVKFYCVDVNKVPQNLVKRGNISKMPTIQVWKDGEMKEEVIGGQKAWVVIEEVSKMLKKYVETEMATGTMEVLLVGAKNLGDSDLIGDMDPNVVIGYKDQERKSTVARGEGESHVWNERFIFKADYPGSGDIYKITLKIFDKDTFSSDDFIGQATIYVKDLLSIGVENGKSEIHTQKYRVVQSYRGEIKVGVKYTRNSQENFLD